MTDIATAAAAVLLVTWVLWPLVRGGGGASGRAHSNERASPACGQCGPRPQANARYCSECGARLDP